MKRPQIVLAAMAVFWISLPILKVQVTRLIPFDIVVIATLSVFVVATLRRRFRPRRGGAYRWVFYLAVASLAVAGFTSGLHAIAVEHWLLETAIFAYVLILLACIDCLARGRLLLFLRVGAIVVAAMSIGFGLCAAVDMFTGFRLEWLYNATSDGIPTERFSGPARFCNQWAMFYACVFPLLLSLIATTVGRWRPVLITAAINGALTVPLTGSRLGTFLVVAELIGFVAVYASFQQEGRGRLRRWVSVGAVAVVAFAVAVALADTVGQSPMAQRAFGSFGLVFGEGRVADDWRTYNWNVALEEFLAHPLLGVGLGTFRLRHDQHEVHSSYLSLMAETGVAGLAPYAIALLAAIGSLGRAFLKQARAGRVDPWAIGLGVALIGALCLGVHFNTTRQRFVWLIFALAVFYGDRHGRAPARGPAPAVPEPAGVPAGRTVSLAAYRTHRRPKPSSERGCPPDLETIS